MPGLDRLIRGILQYRLNILPELVHQFKVIKDNPEPKAVMFSCIDSRVLMTRLLQTNAGDMLMVRNAGNLVPHSHNCRHAPSTEAGALELGCVVNNIDYVMVCGHSDCKAMNLLYNTEGKQPQNPAQSPLTHWVASHGAASYAKYKELKKNGDSKPLVFQGETPNTLFEAYIDPEKKLQEVDRFSQINTLQQLENINSHSVVQAKLAKGKVKLHAFWFDIYTGEFFMFSRKQKHFIQVNENSIHDLMSEYCWTGPAKL